MSALPTPRSAGSAIAGVVPIVLLSAVLGGCLLEAEKRRSATVAHDESRVAVTSPGRVVPLRAGRPAPDWNTEQYDHVAEDGFVDAGNQPLSTFCIDVDTASYSNVRRFLNQGRMPPPGAVRIEELINYFGYSYPAVAGDGDEPFSVVTEVAVAPWQREHRLLMVGLEGRELARDVVPPRNLVFLVDVSGSMAAPNKLALVKYAMRRLVEQLRPEDHVAIVVYAGASGTLVTIAKDVKIQVEFNPAAVEAYRLIGYENRRLANRDCNDDRKDAGEIGAGHTVTALYEVVPAGVTPPEPGVDPLRYQKPRELSDEAGAGELATVKLRFEAPDGERSELVSTTVRAHGADVAAASEDLRFAAAVAAFGMALRSSDHRGDATFSMARDLGRSAVGSDPHGYRSEFVRLSSIARELSGEDKHASAKS